MQYYKKGNFWLNFFNLFYDIIFLTLLFLVFLFVHNSTWDRDLDNIKIFFSLHYKAYFLLILFWILISEYVKYYKNNIKNSIGYVIKICCYQLVLFSLTVFAISGIKEQPLYNTIETLYFSAILLGYLFFSKAIVYLVLKVKFNRGNYLKNGIIIGENKGTKIFMSTIESMPKMIQIKEIFSANNFDENSFQKCLKDPSIKIIYISLNSEFSEKEVEHFITEAQANFKNIEFVSDTYLDTRTTLEVKYYDTFPVLDYSKFPLDSFKNQLLKRLFDIVFSCFVLVFIFPIIYIIVAVFTLLDSGFPIFYKQSRNGVYGNQFDCLKFRTMKPSKDNDVKTTIVGDSRVTSFGKILRKTSLDELPQFINVLKGDMSVVGPRPHMIAVDDHYNKIIDQYKLRHYVKPGITGLAQVRGYRGEVNTDRDMELRIMADIYYVKNWSFGKDILIVIETAIKMIIGDKNAI